jgi:hypothetical protein
MSKSSAEKVPSLKTTSVISSKRNDKHLILYVAPLNTEFVMSIVREQLADRFTFDDAITHAVEDVLPYFSKKCKGLPANTAVLSKKLESIFFHNCKSTGSESLLDALSVEELSILKVASIIGEDFETDLLIYLLQELRLYRLAVTVDAILERLLDTKLIVLVPSSMPQTSSSAAASSASSSSSALVASSTYKFADPKLVVTIANLMTKDQLEQLHNLTALYLEKELADGMVKNLRQTKSKSLQDTIAWHFIRSDCLARKADCLNSFLTLSLTTSEFDSALILAKQLIHLSTGLSLEQIWLKQRESLSLIKPRKTSMFSRRAKICDYDDVNYLLISSKDYTTTEMAFNCSSDVKDIGIDEFSVLSWITTCAMLHNTLGNVKKSEECFRLSITIRIQLLRRKRLSIVDQVMCCWPYLTTSLSSDDVSSVLDMGYCHEEIAASLMLRGKYTAVYDMLSSTCNLLKTIQRSSKQIDNVQVLELHTRLRIMHMFASHYSTSSRDTSKHSHWLSLARSSSTPISPIIAAYDSIYSSLFMLGSSSLSILSLLHVESQINLTISTFEITGIVFKRMACICLSAWMSLMYAHNIPRLKGLLENLEIEATELNQTLIQLWVLQLRVLVALLFCHQNKLSTVAAICLKLETTSVAYVNENTFSQNKQCTTSPDVMSCAVLCHAYTNLGRWGRALDFAERVCSSIKSKKMQVATPFAGIMIILAIISILSIVRKQKDHNNDKLRVDDLRESATALVYFAHHVTDRFPVLAGFLELVKYQYNRLDIGRELAYSNTIESLESAFPSPLDSMEVKLLSYFVASMRIEMIEEALKSKQGPQGQFLVDEKNRQQQQLLQETKIYIRDLYSSLI